MGEGLVQAVLPDKEHLGEAPTSAFTEALVRGNVHKELEDTFSQKASNSFPKVSGNVPSAKAFFHVPDFFSRPLCFWNRAADEAEGFVPLWSDPRHSWASSAAGVQMWPGWGRGVIPISSRHGQSARLQCCPSLSATADAELQPWQLPLQGPAWGTNSTLKNSRQNGMQIRGVLQSSTQRHPLGAF